MKVNNLLLRGSCVLKHGDQMISSWISAKASYCKK